MIKKAIDSDVELWDVPYLQDSSSTLEKDMQSEESDDNETAE